MIRETFQRELQRLQDEVVLLGSMVESAIRESVDILECRDHSAAQRLRDEDRQINQKRFDIEHDALSVIATQAPVAGDMRILAAVLDISQELERLGDYAKGIAKVSLLIGDEPFIKPLVDIPLMMDKACDMLRRALDAFARHDSESARVIPADDDVVDALYDQVYRELMTCIISDPTVIDQANHLLWVAHNLERAADRVTNICERVIFMITGEVVEISGREVREYS